MLRPNLSTQTTPWRPIWVVLLSGSAVVAGVVQVAGVAAPATGFVPVLAWGVFAVAAWWDAATGRIPNPLTYGAVAAGLALHLLAAAATHAGYPVVRQWAASPGPADVFVGFLACCGLGLLGLYLGGMGGGDLKLLAAVGALFGFQAALPVLTYTLMVAVALALMNLLTVGRLNVLLCRIAKGARQTPPSRRVVAAGARQVPLAVAVWVGTSFAYLLPPPYLYL